MDSITARWSTDG